VEAGPEGDSTEPVSERHQTRAAQVVFAFEPRVHCDERSDLPSRSPQQLTVLYSGPAEPLNGHHVVTDQCRDQVVRKILVKAGRALVQGRCRAPGRAPRWPGRAGRTETDEENSSSVSPPSR